MIPAGVPGLVRDALQERRRMMVDQLKRIEEVRDNIRAIAEKLNYDIGAIDGILATIERLEKTGVVQQ